MKNMEHRILEVLYNGYKTNSQVNIYNILCELYNELHEDDSVSKNSTNTPKETMVYLKLSNILKKLRNDELAEFNQDCFILGQTDNRNPTGFKLKTMATANSLEGKLTTKGYEYVRKIKNETYSKLWDIIKILISAFIGFIIGHYLK